MSEGAMRHPGRHIVVHTDGACIDNRGPGGWAAILQSMDGPKELKRKELKGSSPEKMELKAAIEALKAVKSDNPVFVRSDSEYLVKGITQWIAGWKAKGWRKADKKPVMNRELWEELDTLAAARSITWEWVRGHSGDTHNEEVDRLANETARVARWS